MLAAAAVRYAEQFWLCCGLTEELLELANTLRGVAFRPEENEAA